LSASLCRNVITVAFDKHSPVDVEISHYKTSHTAEARSLRQSTQNERFDKERAIDL